MIAYLRGEIHQLTPTSMVVECAGVGYEVNISLATYSAFSGKTSGKVLVAQIIREDAHLLYGFATEAERALFLLLTSVSGIGPNTARVILSSYSPAELTSIIALGQESALKAVKGIGLKTAQRIILELKGKVAGLDSAGGGALPSGVSMGSAGNVSAGEAQEALVALGFVEANVTKAIRKMLEANPNATAEELIRGGLKML